MSSAQRGRAGFTLTELMVATAAMVVVIVYTLGTFTANRNTYVVVDQVSEAHQNALAIASLMERDIRATGYMVPTGGVLCGADNTAGPDVIVLTDPDAIQTADLLSSTFAAGNLGSDVPAASMASWGTANKTITVGDLAVDGQLTYDTDATAGADSDFQVGAGILIADRDDPSNGVGCGIIRSVNVGTRTIVFTPVSASAGINTGAAAAWVAIPGIVYEITGTTLRRNGALMAHDVEDLQAAWFVDLDGDGVTDAGENLGDGSAGDYGAVLSDHSQLRELRFNLVLRTQDQDPKELIVGAQQRYENRAAVATTDGFRRRVVSSTVRIRNNMI